MTAATPDVLVRPMAEADLAAAEALTALTYHELDVRTRRNDAPEPTRRTPARAAAWRERTGHLLRTDPEGCWVADRDGEVVGIATSLVRELLWVLASYAVRPGLQGQGIGRQLLDAALHHGRGCLRGMLNASQDLAAVRRYRLAGSDLHPQMMLWAGCPGRRSRSCGTSATGTSRTSTCSTRWTGGSGTPPTVPTTACSRGSCDWW
ncbi:MAG: GNAT family N-acetyltransferase [Nocardioides sp.]